MSTKRKVQDLVEATMLGQAALAGAGDGPAAVRAIEAALSELSAGVGPEWVEELERASDVLAELQEKTKQLDDGQLRAIPPCPSCRSAELLFADRCTVDGFALAMIVCPHCGDTRLWCPDPRALRAARDVHGDYWFRAITVPTGERGPFR